MSSDQAAYKVLARKYRPSDFSTLIGQDAMVRTLKNAIDAGRLAHAFVLTGVRGVGKTTTARILAKGLNCMNSEGPTVEPCGVCDACVSIADSRHVDVLEMDAASRTGIDDVREIIDSVRYAPVSARFKVYIIDEVHMLSNQAFNGLLKTLEEPPEHVKFIFATTEIRKLPVTVLSRCQRFDLRRVPEQTLKSHLSGILEKEGVTAEETGLDLIVRAAEGSVRDSLSLLDQAIAHSGSAITLDGVAGMLGYADRAQLLDLADNVFKGDVSTALEQFEKLYDHGADPAQIISDLLEISHDLTRMKVAKSAGEGDVQADVTRAAAKEMADRLSVAELTRTWQILLKGLGEVRSAPKPYMAAEMVLIRVAHASTLPDPATLVKQLKDGGAPAAAQNGSGAGNSGAPSASQNGGVSAVSGAHVSGTATEPTASATANQQTAQVLAFDPSAKGAAKYPNPISFDALVELASAAKEGMLASELKYRVSLVDFRVGHISLHPLKGASPNLAQKLKVKLKEWTGENWVITISNEGGAATLGDQQTAEQEAKKREAADHPLVKAVMTAFPGAELKKIEKPSLAIEALPVADSEADSEDDGYIIADDDGDGFEFTDD